MARQKVLYDEKVGKTDRYTYQINQGGELNIKTKGKVDIYFVNGQFSHCVLPFETPETRDHWHVVQGVAERIPEIEASYQVEAKRD